jgi:pyruvate kinase
VPPSLIRHTKIIITLGPASESEAMLEKLIQGGVDVIRLNMAHASHDWIRASVRRVREVSKRLDREVAVMMDIKGPEIRTGDLPQPLPLAAGDLFDFTVQPRAPGTDPAGVRSVHVNYPGIVKDVGPGTIVLVDNGLMRLEVISCDAEAVHCRVLIPGVLTSRRHINLPGVTISLPALTEKDRGDTAVGVEEGIDFVALSFVRTAADIEELRSLLAGLKSPARIIAKIEDQTAISNLDEIVSAADALMVARGDLGIECAVEELPAIQRRAVQACLSQGRPVIIATHMLESMITNAVPTRAEVTDVANAVYEQADCIMLSGETTTGKYPLECVQMLDKIARRIEVEEPSLREPAVFTGERMKVLHSAAVLANELPRSKLVTFTRHGFMAQGLAALRPVHSPVLAITPSLNTLRQLRLIRHVEPILMPFASDPADTIESAIGLLRRLGLVVPGDKLILASDIVAHDQKIDSVQLRTVK